MPDALIVRLAKMILLSGKMVLLHLKSGPGSQQVSDFEDNTCEMKTGT